MCRMFGARESSCIDALPCKDDMLRVRFRAWESKYDIALPRSSWRIQPAWSRIRYFRRFKKGDRVEFMRISPGWFWGTTPEWFYGEVTQLEPVKPGLSPRRDPMGNLEEFSHVKVRACDHGHELVGGGQLYKYFYNSDGLAPVGEHNPKRERNKGPIEARATNQTVQYPSRDRRLLCWRRAVEAKRDAAIVFKAAAEGRPMELEKRLVLGYLVGGHLACKLHADGTVKTPLEAALAGDHLHCARLLMVFGASVPRE